nr:hypothetical protein [Halovivax ruber]
MNATGRTSSRHSPGRLLLPAVGVYVLTLDAFPFVDLIAKLTALN